MTRDEAIEHLRQLRLSRQIPVKKRSKATIKRQQAKKATPKLNKKQAAELLKILGG
jgi:hypothetical protein